MEAIWMIPLYLMIPLVAIILIITGGIKKSKTNIKIGLFLLALPFFHGLLIHLDNNELKNKIAGNYILDDSKKLLKLNDDGTFYLEKSSNNTNYGKGEWDIEIIDIKYVKLDFKNNKQNDLFIEIDEERNAIILNERFYFKTN